MVYNSAIFQLNFYFNKQTDRSHRTVANSYDKKKHVLKGSSFERTVPPYVGQTMLLWIINKSLKAKLSSLVGTGRSWPTTVIVPKKKTLKAFFFDFTFFYSLRQKGSSLFLQFQTFLPSSGNCQLKLHLCTHTFRSLCFGLPNNFTFFSVHSNQKTIRTLSATFLCSICCFGTHCFYPFLLSSTFY